MKNKIKKEQGITLVSLVITIIVMLILAGVSLSMVTGDSSVLKNAQKSLYIISPWMNNYVVNDQFKNQLIELLKRNVEIRIIYGINSPHNSDERDVRTEKIAKELREIGKKYNNLLRLKHGHTHEKLLICDEKYYMNGSYNFLSYSPDGDGYFRNEGCTYIESEMTAKAATEERFNF